MRELLIRCGPRFFTALKSATSGCFEPWSITVLIGWLATLPSESGTVESAVRLCKHALKSPGTSKKTPSVRHFLFRSIPPTEPAAMRPQDRGIDCHDHPSIIILPLGPQHVGVDAMHRQADRLRPPIHPVGVRRQEGHSGLEEGVA